MLRRFFLALQFLTVAPSFWKGDPWPEDLGRSVAFYPLVGAVIGALLWATSLLAGGAPPGMRAFFVLAIWVAVTGALHLDGFLDACDGLFGGMTPERRLEIMHDVHYGSFALAGGVLLLLGKYAALESTGPTLALLLPPIVGRWGMAISIWLFPYARKEGLGRMVKEGMVPVDLAAAFLTSFLFSAAFGWKGVAVWVIGSASALAVAQYAASKLGGLTGDVYGAVCEATELLTLIGVALIR